MRNVLLHVVAVAGANRPRSGTLVSDIQTAIPAARSRHVRNGTETQIDMSTLVHRVLTLPKGFKDPGLLTEKALLDIVP
jgi:hypothetical protein